MTVHLVFLSKKISLEKIQRSYLYVTKTKLAAPDLSQQNYDWMMLMCNHILFLISDSFLSQEEDVVSLKIGKTSVKTECIHLESG